MLQPLQTNGRSVECSVELCAFEKGAVSCSALTPWQVLPRRGAT